MTGPLGGKDRAEFEARLLYLAWRWYRIPSTVAEDIVQTAMLTYLEVRDRYPNPEEHRLILVGIFRNKCREYIAQDVRAARGLRALRTAAQAGTATIPVLPAESTPDDGVLHDLVHREDGRIILEALSELRPKAREMFQLIIEKGATRQELIEHYEINKNTLDSRLHTYRSELRGILEQRGFKL